MKIEKEMTTDSHNRDNRASEEDHNRRKVKEEAKHQCQGQDSWENTRVKGLCHGLGTYQLKIQKKNFDRGFLSRGERF